MKTDEQLQQDINYELKWDPSVHAGDISVTVNAGVVTLRGNVPHYAEKSMAEAIAQRVTGVRAVADEIEVKLLGSYERTDSDIANAALNALEWSSTLPKDLKITVDKGWVTLNGELEWDYQRQAAKRLVTPLMGVLGVSNNISIKSKIQPLDVKTRIEDALKRSAEREGSNINVAVSGGQVTLSGNVHSLHEMQDARMAAWNAPGVMRVENHIKVL